MLKTYRIIPFVFILFLFGFTLITESPVFAQEQWDKSMEMRHPDRPCMKVNGCGVDRRQAAQKASDPYDTNNPVSQVARANGVDSQQEKTPAAQIVADSQQGQTPAAQVVADSQQGNKSAAQAVADSQQGNKSAAKAVKIIWAIVVGMLSVMSIL